MKHNFVAAVLAGVFLLPGWSEVAAASAGRLIPPSDAGRVGLTRAWFTQVRLDPGRTRIDHIRLFEATDRLPDTLFVQTDRGVVHAINAETGQTLWVRSVGSPNHPSMAVGASDDVVGVVNGTRLYLIDRADGRIVWMRQVRGIPADGPVLTDHYAFVPMLNGQVLAYPIRKKQFDEEEEPQLSRTSAPRDDASPEVQSDQSPSPKLATKKSQGPLAIESSSAPPLTCVSLGRVNSQPVFIHDDQRNQYLAWATSKGLFVGYVNLTMREEFAVKYQLRTSSPMVTQPTYLPPGIGRGNSDGLVFVTSAGGEIHAINATRGSELWQYALGQPVNEPVVPIRDRVYVVAELGTLFCLDAMNGDVQWSVDGVSQFVAASKDRVYVADREGRLLALDVNSGARLDSLFASDLPLKFRNVRTDRIFLATPTGLIQCLRETARTEPLRHWTVEKGEDAPDKTPQPDAKPKDGVDPFAAPGEAEEEDPFAAPDEGGANPFD